jgi:hypothetical protein
MKSVSFCMGVPFASAVSIFINEFMTLPLILLFPLNSSRFSSLKPKLFLNRRSQLQTMDKNESADRSSADFTRSEFPKSIGPPIIAGLTEGRQSAFVAMSK